MRHSQLCLFFCFSATFLSNFTVVRSDSSPGKTTMQSPKEASHLIKQKVSNYQFPVTIRGDVFWPRTWKIFAPVPRNCPPPNKSQLLSIPNSLHLKGCKLLPGKNFTVSNGIFDFSNIWNQPETGKTGYAFLEIHSSRSQTVTLGMGADWFFQCWLNGEEIMDTTINGNLEYPPSITNYSGFCESI